MRFSILAVTAVLAWSSAAHPGHDHSEKIAERSAYVKSSERSLENCATSMKASGVEARAVRRRAAAVRNARQKRGLPLDSPYLKARDLAIVLATNHHSNTTYSLLDREDSIFSGNSSCVLSPEVTQGPYFVQGEYIRRNIIEDQQGVPLILDVQVLDINTCEPVVDTMIDFWHCNSTGVYSGIIANGNGDSSDSANINNTFLRGLQPTQYDGVAQFTTLVPGYYTSRAPHIHVLAHFNGTILANSTYSGGMVSHVGQLFFDQELITEVSAISPYNTNTQDLTLNADDSILSQEAADGLDPVIEYSLLGDSIEDGIFAWISFGIDLTISESVSPAAYYYAEGGVESSSSSSGGGGGGSGPGGDGPGSNGTAASSRVAAASGLAAASNFVAVASSVASVSNFAVVSNVAASSNVASASSKGAAASNVTTCGSKGAAAGSRGAVVGSKGAAVSSVTATASPSKSACT